MVLLSKPKPDVPIICVNGSQINLFDPTTDETASNCKSPNASQENLETATGNQVWKAVEGGVIIKRDNTIRDII